MTYFLFSGLIVYDYVKRDGDVASIIMTSYRIYRTEPTEKLLQEKLNATTPT